VLQSFFKFIGLDHRSSPQVTALLVSLWYRGWPDDGLSMVGCTS
jgi:hypothetical protein